MITQNLIPIALYASVEIIKAVQSYFISQDLDLYYEKNDMPCIPRTWNLGDDLGQVEYLFSDKTGTLTENVMKVKRCTINGQIYGSLHHSDMKGPGLAGTWKEVLDTLSPNNFASPYFEFDGMSLALDLNVEKASKQKAEKMASLPTPIHDFFTLLALCHSVFVDRTHEGILLWSSSFLCLFSHLILFAFG